MSFSKTRKFFSVIAAAQMTLIITLALLINEPSDFMSVDVTSYDRSAIVLNNEGKLLNAFLSPADEWCIPVSLDKTGAWTAAATIAIEDKRFYEHNGVDFVAIGRAIVSNIKSWRAVSGASTITSQLIRVSRPRERTLYNKAMEFWSAMRLETVLTKAEILELYLNRAPFGGNIRGIEAASMIYFNKSAETLSLAESVTLISMLRSPSRLRPDRHADKARALRDTNIDYLIDRKIITSEEGSLAESELLPGKRYPMPNNASMAVTHIKNQASDKWIIKSAIDSRLQLLLEENISGALKDFASGITGAGIIVENTTGLVKAYVGNARHGENLPYAQVDCGASMRSPGSTLKPFIYGAAIEKGLITPASMIADTPLAFRGSAPRNFDMSYRGPVSARNALASSLNAPAVRVLRLIGYPTAKTALNKFGFAHINKPPGEYTDSLVLGGCEVTMIEIAAAYRTLANEGRYSPLSWVPEATITDNSIISPEAAYLITNILQDERRLLPIYQEIFKGRNMPIAFKTGTSYGLRDAWTAGYSDKYTVAVWIGSPPGRGHSNLVGMKAAAPIFLEIMRSLWSPSEKPIAKPENVYIRTVCALSGDTPNKECPLTLSDLAISGVSKTYLCSLHRNVDGKSFIAWPPELRAWANRQEESSPPLKRVKIIRPVNAHTIIKQNNGLTEKVFLAAEGDYPHYWYLDGKFIGTSHGDGMFIDVTSGPHKASVLSGNASDSVSFEVRTPGEIRSTNSSSHGNILN